MPYIPDKDDREYFRGLIRPLVKEIDNKKGNLNYIICEMVAQIIMEYGGPTYTRISNWIDAVHGAERELTRRLLVPYEKIQTEKNGDVESFADVLRVMR